MNVGAMCDLPMQPEGVQEGRHSLHDQQDGYCETSPSEKVEDEKEKAP